MNVKPDAAKGDVIFTIGTLEIGGTELHLASVAAELVSRGWNVSIYSLAGEGPLARSLTESGVNIICPPIKRDGRPAPMIVRFIRFVDRVRTPLYSAGTKTARDRALLSFRWPI